MTLTCREFIEVFLGAWLDGELPPRRADACDRHAQTCGDCADYVRGHRQVVAALRLQRLTAPQCKALPEDLVRRILAAAGLSAASGTKGVAGS